MLGSKEIVQINATIIAGILIFMTLALTSFSDKDTSVYRFIITFITSTVLIPYALSASTALDGKDHLAARLLKFGFFYSVAVGMTFVVLSYLGDIAAVLN